MRRCFQGGLIASLFLTVLFAGCMGQAPTPQESPTALPTEAPTLPPTEVPTTVPPTEVPTLPPTQAPLTSFSIVYATGGEPESLDPAFDYETQGYQIMHNIYENLVWYDNPDITKVKPWLAESYTISPDGKTYNFVLRKGIKFHDGTDFNADAVVFSLNRAMTMGLGPSWMLTDYVESGGVKKVDDYAVSVTLKFPYVPFINIMANPIAAIVSPKAVDGHGGITTGQQNQWMNKNAVGTGPFKFVSWNSQEIVLQRNEEYWGTPDNTGVAKPEKVIMKNIDESKRSLGLASGDIDIADLPARSAVDLQKFSGITIDKKGISPSINYIAFNYRNPIFQDMHVRAAIAHAIDYTTLIDQMTEGNGVRARGPIPTGFFGHNPSLYMYDYNMEKAKQHLAQSKYPNGFKIEVAYNTGNNTRKWIALHLQSQLAKLNVEVTVKEYDWPTYLQQSNAGKLEMYIIGWLPDFADPDDFVDPFLHSKGYFSPRTAFSDPEMDRLIDAGKKRNRPHKTKEDIL